MKLFPVKCHLSPVKCSLRGFTLIEMMIAFAIFAVIMVISAGSLISLIEANHKAQTLKTVVNNLHFAFENMSRNIRTGAVYRCGADGALGNPRDCATSGNTSVAFSARTGSVVIYRWNGTTLSIERSLDSGGTFAPITAPEIQVDQLQFYVDGSCPKASNNPSECPSDTKQPRVLIVARGRMLGKGRIESKFDIETMVSQRQLDI